MLNFLLLSALLRSFFLPSITNHQTPKDHNSHQQHVQGGDCGIQGWEWSVTIFTLHHTFPYSCLYLLGDLCTSLSLHILRLLLIAYSDAAMHSTAQQCTVCLLMHSLLTHAQSAYLCTAHLPTCSLLVQYIRTLWTHTFSS